MSSFCSNCFPYFVWKATFAVLLMEENLEKTFFACVSFFKHIMYSRNYVVIYEKFSGNEEPRDLFIYSRKLENTLGALISLSTMPIHQFSLQKSESCTVHAKIDLPYIKKNLENILTKVILNTNPNYLASKSLPKETKQNLLYWFHKYTHKQTYCSHFKVRLHSQYIENTMKFCVKTEVKRRFQDWLTIVTVVFWSEMQLRLAQKRRPSWQDSGGVRNLSLGKVSSGLSGATTDCWYTLRFCSSLPAFFPPSQFIFRVRGNA